jgi:hypothetical protein
MGKPSTAKFGAAKYCSLGCYHAMKLRASKDLNHKEIQEALERMGALVLDTSGVGRGIPDLIVSHMGRVYLVEIKNPRTAYGRRGLNPMQQRLKDAGWHVEVLTSVDEAVSFIQGHAA